MLRKALAHSDFFFFSGVILLLLGRYRDGSAFTPIHTVLWCLSMHLCRLTRYAVNSISSLQAPHTLLEFKRQRVWCTVERTQVNNKKQHRNKRKEKNRVFTSCCSSDSAIVKHKRSLLVCALHEAAANVLSFRLFVLLISFEFFDSAKK